MHGVFTVPSGGWNFPADGKLDSTVDPHYEPSYQHLVDWLKGYRIANGLPLGDPAQDVLSYHNKINPSSPVPFQAPTISPPKNFRERVTQWLSNRFQDIQAGTLVYVEDPIAKERAAICVNCPHNQNWKVGCPPCVDNAERLILMITKGRTIDKNLMACGVAGHSNEAAVTLDEKHLKHRNQYQDQLPDFCWMKKL
jgi:hypothetical protein